MPTVAFPFPLTGAALRQARTDRGITVKRLAKMSDVSRRHLAILEKGGNVSLLVLVKVAAALQMSEVPITDDLRVITGATGAGSALLIECADEIEAGIATFQKIAGALRENSEAMTVETEDDRLSARATRLLQTFLSEVKSLGPAQQIERLERLSGDMSAETRPRKRRKVS